MTIERRAGSGRIRIAEILSKWLGVPPGRTGRKTSGREAAAIGTRSHRPVPSQRKMVEMRIAEFIEDSTSIARAAVSRTHVLPLCFDWSGFLGLRPEGQVVSVLYDDESGEYEIIHEERVRNLALCQGTKRYPDLPFLQPAKPPDAMECSHCRGTGQVTLPQGLEQLSEKFTCYCGGLGWLPHDRKP